MAIMGESDYGPGEDPTMGGEFPPFQYDPSVEDPNLSVGTQWPPTPSQPRGNTPANILALLLGAGGLAGVGQNLFGGRPTTTEIPRLSPLQTQLIGGAQGQFGQTGNILQQLLAMIQNPQLNPAQNALVEQAYRPQMGDIASQAIESARNRGFAGGAELLQGGPAGAIAGPALSNLQGQIAGSKLGLQQNQMTNLLQALRGSQSLGQSQGNLAASLPTQKRTQTPGPTILQTLGQLGPTLGSIGNIVNPPKQSFDFSSLLNSLFGSNNAG